MGQPTPSDQAKRRAYDHRMSGIQRDFEGIGRPALHMDQADMQALMTRFPELDPVENPDAEIRGKCWLKWIRSSASEPYRLRTKL